MPKWVSGQTSWIHDGQFYTTGLSTGIYDLALAERQALLNAYSNLAMSVQSAVRSEMQTTAMGNSGTAGGFERLFSATDALLAENIKVRGALVHDRHYEKIMVSEGYGQVGYVYNCYVLLKMDAGQYAALLSLAGKGPESFRQQLLESLDRSRDALDE